VARLDPEYDRNVFINCPFDPAYLPIFEAIVFSVHVLGFRARCALERLDSSQVRIQKILQLIRMCRYSIHDLSRTELDEVHGLPRFNMPLELGIDLGCKEYSRAHAAKSFLIFDAEQYRYQKYLSDIAGHDIHRHGNDPEQAIIRVRDWLRTESGASTMLGGAVVYERYLEFRRNLPRLCAQQGLNEMQLTFTDLTNNIVVWLGRA
jgi:hypothetical protein